MGLRFAVGRACPGAGGEGGAVGGGGDVLVDRSLGVGLGGLGVGFLEEGWAGGGAELGV